MTKIKILYDASGCITGISCRDHAGGNRNENGDDLACASVSLCMVILETGLRQVIPPTEPLELNILEARAPGVKSVLWRTEGLSIGVQAIARTIAEALKSIAFTYKDNISVEETVIKKGDGKHV